MKKYKGILKIKNIEREKEFEKLNNYMNLTSDCCRILYNRCCENLPKILNDIKNKYKDIEIEFSIEEIK